MLNGIGAFLGSFGIIDIAIDFYVSVLSYALKLLEGFLELESLKSFFMLIVYSSCSAVSWLFIGLEQIV